MPGALICKLYYEMPFSPFVLSQNPCFQNPEKVSFFAHVWTRCGHGYHFNIKNKTLRNPESLAITVVAGEGLEPSTSGLWEDFSHFSGLFISCHILSMLDISIRCKYQDSGIFGCHKLSHLVIAYWCLLSHHVWTRCGHGYRQYSDSTINNNNPYLPLADWTIQHTYCNAKPSQRQNKRVESLPVSSFLSLCRTTYLLCFSILEPTDTPKSNAVVIALNMLSFLAIS